MPTVLSAINEYLFAKKGRISKPTYEWYEQKLLVFNAWCEAQHVTLAHMTAPLIRQFLHSLTLVQPPLTDSTRRGYAQVIKGFLSWCANEEEYEDLVSGKIAARVESPKVEKTIIAPFSREQVHALLNACEREDSRTLQARGKAIIYLLLDTGIRASELAFDSSRPEEETGLRLKCVFLDPDDSFIRVKGKGKKERDVNLGQKSRASLRKYISRYRGGSQSPYVFLARHGNPLTVRGLEEFMARLGERAKVSDCFVHRWRHTFAHLFKDKTSDIHMVSEALGHTDVKTTQRYLQKFSGRQKMASVADDL